MTPIDQLKILRETIDHVIVMYDNAMVRAEKAEAELARIASSSITNDDALDIEYFRHLKEVEVECLQQAIINGKGAQREADLLGKVERLERELAKVSNAKELNHINDSYEHEMRTFSKRPSSNYMHNLVEER